MSIRCYVWPPLNLVPIPLSLCSIILQSYVIILNGPNKLLLRDKFSIAEIFYVLVNINFTVGYRVAPGAFCSPSGRSNNGPFLQNNSYSANTNLPFYVCKLFLITSVLHLTTTASNAHYPAC